MNLLCEPFIFVSAGTFCYVSVPCTGVCVETNNDGKIKQVRTCRKFVEPTMSQIVGETNMNGVLRNHVQLKMGHTLRFDATHAHTVQEFNHSCTPDSEITIPPCPRFGVFVSNVKLLYTVDIRAKYTGCFSDRIEFILLFFQNEGKL